MELNGNPRFSDDTSTVLKHSLVNAFPIVHYQTLLFGHKPRIRRITPRQCIWKCAHTNLCVNSRCFTAIHCYNKSSSTELKALFRIRGHFRTTVIQILRINRHEQCQNHAFAYSNPRLCIVTMIAYMASLYHASLHHKPCYNTARNNNNIQFSFRNWLHHKQHHYNFTNSHIRTANSQVQ